MLSLVKGGARSDGADMHVMPSLPSMQSVADETELLNETIHAIYQSVNESEPWRACLALMVQYMQVVDATIVVRPSTELELGYLVCYPGDAKTELEYCSGWYKLDPFLDLPSERVLTVADVMSDQQWRTCDYYRDFFCGKLCVDANHVLGVNITTRAGTVSRLRLHRFQHMPSFSSQDKRRLALLVPHIKQAMTLAAHVNRNESEREIYEEGLDRLNIGVIVLDETGQLLRANPVACHMLNGADGIKLVDLHLEGGIPADTRELRRLFASSREDSTSVTAMSFTRPSGRRKLAAVVRSIPLMEESEGKSRPAWAVFLRDPEAPASAAHDIARQLFDFTPAEAGLAIELANGLNLDEAAEKLGIKRNTVRAHLRAIFSKAGVTRQSELVRILLNGVLGLSAGER
jgi:DNA-binding CsgD family transcriptional regulator/PAS domain-containing protein